MPHVALWTCRACLRRAAPGSSLPTSATAAAGPSRKTSWGGTKRVLRHLSASPLARQAEAEAESIASCRDQGKGQSLAQPPVVRFAPSPTGQLHLGGLRTALFNHLFARKHGGKWILRIEDTDRKRLVPGAVQAMQEVLAWAGLDYDEGPGRPGASGPYTQSERIERYTKYADRLVETGKAYYDFREATGVIPDGFKQDTDNYVPPSDEERRQLIQAGKRFVVRLRLPQRKATLPDAVYGTLHFPYDKAIDDPVLLKSDGWPTYHLANVVDDAEMGITHVLRGEEWLPSVPIHLALYEALELPTPVFAHLPLLVNPDGSKLSKRHADVHVESYRQAGVEPEALNNFVALMGSNWHMSTQPSKRDGTRPNSSSEDSTSEVFSMNDMIERFSLDNVSQSRATPNLSKLHFLNRQHLRRQLSDQEDGGGRADVLARFAQTIADERERAWQPSDSFPQDRLRGERLGIVADVMLGRSSSLQEVVRDLRILFESPRWKGSEAHEMKGTMDENAFDLALSVASQEFAGLTSEEADSVAVVDKTLKVSAKILQDALAARGGMSKSKAKGRGRSALLRPLRYALTGRQSGPTVAETIAILGKQRSLARIAAARKEG